MKIWFILMMLWLGIASATEAQRNLEIAPVSGTKRVALIIGNAAYPGAGALKNPANDARDIAAKLRKLGFDVTVRTDVVQKEMLRSLTDFGDKVQSGSEVLFFYAGHGMQVRGRNYLIPIDAEIRSESSVSSEAVDVDQLLDKLSAARLSIVILDACRNNPFERQFRGGGQGLAQINAPTGTLIAYATAPGKVAADGEGRNGLYTAELLSAMDIPGIKIEDVFKRVRGNVVKKSGDAQTPWESSSLTGDFYFRFGEGTTALAAPQTTATIDTGVMEITFWESIKDSTDAEDFQAYLDKYPNGLFVVLAERRVKRHAKLDAPVASPDVPMLPGAVFQDCPDCPEMVVIPAGSFEMGAEDYRDSVRPVHVVRIDKPFSMGKAEVTQGQWKAVMGNNPSHFFGCGDDCPVERVSWDDAQEYLRRLSQKTGKSYRLPSEAEWEYACRAGSKQDYCGSNNIDSVAWHDGNSDDKTHPVAKKQPNAWGLYDMSGNVWEWVQDFWNKDYNGAPTDGSAWTMGGPYLVERGGSWIDGSRYTKAAIRNAYHSTERNYFLGFRLARSLSVARAGIVPTPP